MTTDQQLNRSSFNQLFRGALLDGLQLSSIIIPGGLAIHQFRQHKQSNLLSTSAHTTATASSSPPPVSPSNLSPRSSTTSKINSLNHRVTHFLKWNGLLTFGFSLIYAALLTTSSSLIHNNVKPLSTVPKQEKPASQLAVHSNDYSIIGGTLGGLITTTVFWNRRLLSLLSIIPGGIGIGVGAGLSTAYIHSLQSRSSGHPNESTPMPRPHQNS